MREGIQRDQWCIHPTDSVEKHFLNRRNTYLNLSNRNSCNCWTINYILYQLDTGRCVQGGIECHGLSPEMYLSTCVHLRCKLIHRLGCSNLMMGIGTI